MNKWDLKGIANDKTLINHPRIKDRLSDELYDAIQHQCSKAMGPACVVWLHLADCVERGTCTPNDAWDCIRLGYVREFIKARESSYAHLL